MVYVTRDAKITRNVDVQDTALCVSRPLEFGSEEAASALK